MLGRGRYLERSRMDLYGMHMNVSDWCVCCVKWQERVGDGDIEAEGAAEQADRGRHDE